MFSSGNFLFLDLYGDSRPSSYALACEMERGFSFGHFYFLYLCTLAPAPPMIASTSFLLAIVVSPGVVIASAPCAAP